MTWNDLLTLLYNFRLYPDVNAASHMLKFIEEERLCWKRETALAFAGLVTGLCDRYPKEYEDWKKSYPKLIKQCYLIAKSPKERKEPMWAEYLVNRWLIPGTDKEAWELLLLCHYGHSKEQVTAAQSACDKICRSIDSKPITNANGIVMGTVQFEDMRLQMVRLAREFSSLPVNQRQLPFDLIPFSKEYQMERLDVSRPPLLIQ
jgi:hypothetical protein